MNKLICILFTALVFASCSSTKKTLSRDEKRTDSATTQKETVVNTSSDRVRERVEKDSVIGLRKRSVEDSVDKADLEIPKTSTGKSVPRLFEKYEDGVRAYAVIDTNGNLRYGCDVDSITLVVRSLIRDSISTHRQFDSLAALYERQASTHETTVVSTKVTTPSWWAKWWRVIALLLIELVLVIIYWYVKRK